MSTVCFSCKKIQPCVRQVTKHKNDQAGPMPDDLGVCYNCGIIFKYGLRMDALPILDGDFDKYSPGVMLLAILASEEIIKRQKIKWNL